MKKKYLELNALKLGLTGGILGAFLVLVTSIMFFINFGAEWINLILSIYGKLGYNPATIFGNILGMIYGFIDCFILTWLFGIIYNKLL